MKRPGCITPAGLLVAAMALLAVALVGLASGGQMFSPGPLSGASRTGVVLGGISSHSELRIDCTACHEAPWSARTMADRCLDCHTDIQVQVGDPGRLHGQVDIQRCRDCHTEHRGLQAPLTRAKELVVDHELLAFSRAVHQTTAEGRPFACVDCHTESLARFDPGTCETCHRSYQAEFAGAHVREFGGDCRACHDGTDTFSDTRFYHNRTTFPLTGQHTVVPCAQCHTGVRDLAGFQQAPATCAGCHAVDDVHLELFGTDCAVCHNTANWNDVTFTHSFPLDHGGGGTIPCTVCHTAPDAYKTYTCYGCHDQALMERVHPGVANLADCVRCHPSGQNFMMSSVLPSDRARARRPRGVT